MKEGREGEGEKELGGGGGASCRMKARLTFAGRNERAKVNIKECHLFACGVSGDESLAAKR